MSLSTPNQIAPLLAQATAHHTAGRLAEAEALYRQILKAQPANPDALQLLGLVARQSGRDQVALDLMTASLQANPRQAHVHNNLGVLLQSLGRASDAEAAFRKAVEVDPGYADAHCNLGRVLAAGGHDGPARAALEQALRLQPDLAAAHLGLAEVWLASGGIEAATAAAGKAIEAAPGMVEAHLTLGLVLMTAEDWRGAESAYRQALTVEPANAVALNGKGAACHEQGRLEKAVSAYRSALQEAPEYVEAHNNLGVALEEMGRLTEARTAYQTALDLNPGYAKAYKHLAFLEKTRAPNERSRAAEALFADPETGPEDRMYLGFATARAREDMADFDGAFDHYAAANKIKRPSAGYLPEQAEQDFARRKVCFSRTRLETWPGSGVADDSIVFVIGMPRSGTSLVEQILASHGDVEGHGELSGMMDICVQAHGQPFSGDGAARLDRLRGPDWAEMAGAYLDAVDRDGGGQDAAGTKLHVDKLPHNFLNLGMIHLLLPKARIVHCRRDPLDLCLSNFKTYFTKQHPYAYDLEDLAHYYLLYQNLMAHWRDVLPGKIHEIQYEDLVSDPQAETRRLLAHLELPWDDACLSFHKTDRAVRTASAVQVRQPLFATSVGAWRRFEKHLGPLRDRLKGPK